MKNTEHAVFPSEKKKSPVSDDQIQSLFLHVSVKLMSDEILPLKSKTIQSRWVVLKRRLPVSVLRLPVNLLLEWRRATRLIFPSPVRIL